jgi:hypothetical protein
MQHPLIAYYVDIVDETNLLLSNLRPTRNNYIAVAGTDITDSMTPTVPGEDGMNINVTMLKIQS